MEHVGSKKFIAGQPFISRLSSTIQPENTHLKIYLNDAQIDSSLSDIHDGKLLQLHSFQKAIPQLDALDFYQAVIGQNEFLKIGYAKVEISISAQHFTIFPEEFFNDQLKHAWKLGFIDSKDELDIFSDFIPEGALHIAYAVPKGIMNLFTHNLHDFEHHHSITAEIKTLLSKNRGANVYCNVQSGKMQIIYMIDQKLVFGNAFYYETQEDFLYFLLASYHSLKLNPEKIPIILYGQIVKDSALFQLIYKYIRNIEFGKAPVKIAFDNSYPFPPHFYFSLYC